MGEGRKFEQKEHFFASLWLFSRESRPQAPLSLTARKRARAASARFQAHLQKILQIELALCLNIRIIIMDP
jgi:hypothetical protein